MMRGKPKTVEFQCPKCKHVYIAVTRRATLSRECTECEYEGTFHRRKIAMKPWIIIVLALLAAQGALAFERVENVTVNASQLSKTYQFDFTLELEPDGNATLNRTDAQGLVNLTYPSTVESGVNESSNVTVSVYALVSRPSARGNQSLEAVLVINRSGQGQQDVLRLGVLVIDDIPPPTITLTDGDFHVRVPRDALPYDGTLEYELTGKPSADITIVCSTGFLTCPHQLRFADNGQLRFKVEYKIPVNTTTGRYEHTINFTSDANATSAKVTLEVVFEDLRFKEFDFDHDCIVALPGDQRAIKVDCVRSAEGEVLERVNGIYESCIQQSQRIVENGFNISKRDAQACEAERTKLNQHVVDLGILVDQCTDERDQARADLLKNETACLAEVFDKSVQMKQDAEEYRDELRKKYWRRTIWTLVIIAALLTAGFYIQQARKHNWVG